MHPPEFVATMIAKGRTEELIALIRDFNARLIARKTPEHAMVFNFAFSFLISVESQLRLLKNGQAFDDDNVLSVWRELGLFGIERTEIEVLLSNDAKSDTGLDSQTL